MASIPPGTIPPPGDWFIDEGVVRFPPVVSQEVIDWWEAAFVTPFSLTPHEMASIVSRNLPDLEDFEFYTLDPVKGVVSFGMLGKELPEFQMDFSWMIGQSVRVGAIRKLIHNDSTYLHRTYQGQKISTQLMANLYVLAERLKISVLGLSAKDRGPYAWPTFGFAPISEDWEKVVPILSNRADHFRPQIGDEVYAKVADALASPDPRSIWFICDRLETVWSAPVNGTEPPVQTTLGVAMLAHSDIRWYGELDLGKDAARARLLTKIKDYLP